MAAVGYTITRRCGGAVERNRIRRRLRACVDGLDLAPGSYLVTAAPEACSATYAELEASLAEACARAREAAS